MMCKLFTLRIERLMSMNAPLFSHPSCSSACLVSLVVVLASLRLAISIGSACRKVLSSTSAVVQASSDLEPHETRCKVVSLKPLLCVDKHQHERSHKSRRAKSS